MTEWRLLVDDGPAPGAWNMAVDRAIQMARERGAVPPTLRIYQWVRPTVSLGRFQDVDSVDRAFCSAAGIDVVRRHTGGRGVLHDDEVTYSIVAGLDDGVPRGTNGSYRMLCGGVAEAYRLLGVDAELTDRSRGTGASAACYLHATQADLSFGLRKLSGSAQVWVGNTVLQHGSFTRSRDIAREARVFRLSAEEATDLDEQTATLDALLGESPSRARVRQAIAEGFAASLGVELAVGELSDTEAEAAARIHAALLGEGL